MDEDFFAVISKREKVRPFARSKIIRQPNLVVPHVNMGSYLYYIWGESLFSDQDFDWMCKFALDNWDTLEHHHKFLLTVDRLKAGSQYDVKADEYPEITKNTAVQLLYSWQKRIPKGMNVWLM